MNLNKLYFLEEQSKKENFKTFKIDLEKETLNKLTSLANEYNVSLNTIYLYIINEYMLNIEKQAIYETYHIKAFDNFEFSENNETESIIIDYWNTSKKILAKQI